MRSHRRGGRQRRPRRRPPALAAVRVVRGVVIEQAKGVLAERNALSVEAAFDALRLYARDQNIKLTDLAVTVVHNNFTPGFPRAAWDGASRSAVRRGGAFVTPIVPSWLVLRPGPGSAPQACAGSPGCVSSPCSR